MRDREENHRRDGGERRWLLQSSEFREKRDEFGFKKHRPTPAGALPRRHAPPGRHIPYVEVYSKCVSCQNPKTRPHAPRTPLITSAKAGQRDS